MTNAGTNNKHKTAQQEKYKQKLEQATETKKLSKSDDVEQLVRRGENQDGQGLI